MEERAAAPSTDSPSTSTHARRPAPDPLVAPAIYRTDVCHWGADRVTSAPVRLLAAHLLRLPESDTGDVLWLRNHPVRLFDVMGVVVGLHPRAPSLANCGERVTFTLDDSTGLVECVLWLHEWSGEGAGREKRPRPQAEVAAELDALRLGALVHVHGTFRRFRDSRQLSVERLWREADPNAECVHWLRCRELWRKCYSVDFTIPQAVRQLEAARDRQRLDGGAPAGAAPPPDAATAALADLLLAAARAPGAPPDLTKSWWRGALGGARPDARALDAAIEHLVERSLLFESGRGTLRLMPT